MFASLPPVLLLICPLAVAMQRRQRVRNPTGATKRNDRYAAIRLCFLRENGATAIEFAFVLPLLVGMFYAIFTYGYVFVLNQALNFASEEAARAAVAVVDGGTGALALQQTAANLAVDQALRFMPASQRTLVGAPVLSPPTTPGGLYKVQVTLTMPISTLFPVITLPLIGVVPQLPTNLRAISID